MQTRQLGPFTVSAIGLGGMPLSMAREPQPSREQAFAVVKAALDAGITFIDTADIYAPSWDTMGHNEALIADALDAYGPHDHVIVATKGGITRSEGEEWGRDGSEEYLRSALEKSLKELRRDVIDLYQWHRPDRTRDYAGTVRVFKKFLDEGLVKAVGISNANPDEIRLAHDVLEGKLASVQNEFSPRFRSSEPELELCDELGVAFLPWSPLGGTNREQNVGTGGNASFDPIREVAEAHGVSVYQVVLAWELAKSERVIPIPGASRPESIIDSAKAADLTLTADELAAVDAAR